jgi:hypothetical protein
LIAFRDLQYSYGDALVRFNAVNKSLDTCFDLCARWICRLTETELKAFLILWTRLYLLPVGVHIRQADIFIETSQTSMKIVLMPTLLQGHT